MINNLHITLTPFMNESRILRETASLIRSKVVDRVHVIAMHEGDLPELLQIDNARSVYRLRLATRGWSKTLLVQLLKYVEFCWRALRHAKLVGVDVLNVHRLELLPLGVLIKWRYGAKLVYDAHELETEASSMRGIRKTLARAVERLLIRQADLVIVVSPSIEAWYATRYGALPIVTVLNSPPYREPPVSGRLRGGLGVGTGARLILYQGGLVKGRGIERLLQAFERLDDDRYVLVFMGYGDLESLVRKSAERSGRIHFHQAVAPDVLLEYTADADIGIAFIEDTCLSYHYCLPNKLFEYLAAGLPVIVSNLPEMERLVTGYKVGVVIDDIDANSLRCALAELQEMDDAVLAERLKEASRAHSWEVQEQAMIAAYQTHNIG